ncbi:MAG: WYL domain-containing protein [Pseudomonadota bacterium]|nr:WYL domain-containing protein [Pseudomonadota bacterium]
MDRTERFYKIDHLLQGATPVPIDVFLKELGVSLATFKRDLEYMRDRLNAPIVWDRDANGYRFEQAKGAGARYELPGLWFNPSEAQALLTLEHLIESLEPSILGPHLEPLKTRLTALLSTGDHSADEVRRRIRVIPFGTRRHEPKHFALVASALLSRRRLRIEYFNRTRNETTEREVSPQRLVYYRANWYLDTWDHLRNDLRSFSVDAIRAAAVVDTKTKDVPDVQLDAVLASGYGIFSGTKVQWATLRFTPERARYVSQEEWHPKQRTRWLADGSYQLEVPYSSEKELAMDILKHGAEVEVVGPKSLRGEIAERLRNAAGRY